MPMITRRGVLSAAFAALATMPLARAGSRPRRKPNFIIILCDDLGYGDLGAFGGRMIATPNLDAMAAAGLKMTQAYASGNLCTPSRAGLLTGRYPIRTGLAWQVIQASDIRGLPPAEVTIPEALGPDYVSALVGKWHLGHVEPFWPPTAQGFDLFFGLPYSHDMTPLSLFTAGKGIEFTREDVDFPRLTQRFFDRGMKFIEENRDRPFFLELCLTAPHLPLNPSFGHAGHSKAAAYGDVVEEVDEDVGRLLAILKQLDLDQDTYVIVTSDNGPFFEGSAGPLRDRKGGAGFDGGYRVPLLIWGSGRVPAGSVSTALTMNIDFLPSLVALSGGKPPEGVTLDGIDMSAVWHGRGAATDRELILFDNEKVAAIRLGKWKYVGRSYYRGSDIPLRRLGIDYLFDVEQDPAEDYNLATAHPEVLADMKARFDRARRAFEPLGTHGDPDRAPAGMKLES